MALPELSSGSIEKIMSGEQDSNTDEPVLQVLGTKRLAGGNAERYRLLLSDGQHLQSFSMLSTQLNHFVQEGSLSDFTIIRVKQFCTSVVNKTENEASRRVLIIINLEVVKPGEEVGKKIGEPINLETKSDTKKTNGSTPMETSEQKPNNVPAARSQLPQTLDPVTFDGKATHPISGLSPYQNKWVIKARVTAKSAMRTWSNARGEGKLFNFELMDESGQIRCTAFRDVAEKYYDIIEVDKVFFISKATLKPANKQFNNLPSDYEMVLGNESILQECTETTDVPAVKYDFVPIAQIPDKPPNSIIDIIGVCRNIGQMDEFTAKSSGRVLKKREITLVDQSNAAISLVLWGKDAEDFIDQSQPVVLIKGARINEFNGGKSVSLVQSGHFKRNPDLPEGHRLRGWFDNGGAEGIQINIPARIGGGSMNAEWVTFYEAKMRNLGNGDDADFFQTKATINLIRDSNNYYKACANLDCNKKVVDLENGQYSCEKCNQQFPNFRYRLMLNLSIGDWTSNRWVTAFATEAEKLFGKTSEEVCQMCENDKEAGSQFFASYHFKSFMFKLRTKSEFYGDSQRNKINVMQVAPIVYKDYNEYLIKNIQRLTGVGKH